MSVPSKKTLFKSRSLQRLLLVHLTNNLIMRSQQQSTSFTVMFTTGYLAIALSRKLVLLTRNHQDLGKVTRIVN
ncbi:MULTISPECIES: hypothetical protein [unclassified Nostoc]|uniref:hypothetical protein n=1 Tax=unclassified Nostoc TaxID=2593658 RepID=UPI001D9262E8|nr:hypothetical protein [Nostoc sp. JL23]MBN3876061.1 hypothetical protein [Nostoc sp. JL23]